MRRFTVALVVGLLLVLAGCSGGDDAMTAGESVAVDPEAAVEDGAVAFDEEAAFEEAAEPDGEVAQDTSAAQDDVGTALPPVSQDLGVGDRIIKQGTVSLEVPEGEFDVAYARVVEAARRVGGTVVSSTTQTIADGEGSTGSVTVRVPVANYEDLLVGIGDIGEIRSRDVTASDVSTEFVDLQSRQRNLEAQERFYLGLLDEAAGVPDAIAIQQQLDGITAQLEQIKGRLAYLDERTAFSTLTVELFESGSPLPLTSDEPSTSPTLARFWQLARDAFVNVVGAALVLGAFLAPLAGLGLLAFLVWRAFPKRPARVESRPEPERERAPIP